VKVVFGTDSGVSPHGLNGKQFAWMVRYGMTPVEAIQAATIVAAEALGRNDVGVLEAGRFADIVAVQGDPAADVTLLEAIPVVIKGGEVVKDRRTH
jgi:imidazolonepropionase-like amidohydrolase